MGDSSYVIVQIGWFILICIVAILVKVCCLCARKKESSTSLSPSRGPGPGRSESTAPARVLESYRIDPSGVTRVNTGNVFTVPEERSHNRYGDIFFIEPGSEEANRIREQLEKDDKELPSYDEVMRMCNLTTPTSGAAGVPQTPLPEPLGPIGIAALPAPPYSETDPHSAAGGATVIAMEPVQPSTSRAAQVLPTAAPPPISSPASQTTV
ncbi:hypothetical protein KR074_009433 [Drosophila pseudoananassae]|nr:hypothetical protein KR074_009433 [Drosophila pseudoananassae]